MGKVAVISGVNGQDGAYIADILLSKGYEVHGIIRRCSVENKERIFHLKNIQLHFGDLSDTSSLMSILYDVQPDEIYALGAQSHVKISFDIPEYTADVTGIGALRLLEVIRKLRLKTKIIQASSSEMFGSSPPPQNENTPFNPESPYAASKVFAYHMVRNYRKSYGIFASNSICFNHESILRGINFVTRKITIAATRIKLGLQNELYLGNLDAYRDWGHAKDYCRAMHMILQHDVPDDFVIATGENHSVKEFAELVFEKLDLDPYKYIKIDKNLFRPSEVNNLLGDYSKIKNTLGWEPKISFNELVDEMIASDMCLAKKELLIKENL